jgi:hypothetical protein
MRQVIFMRVILPLFILSTAFGMSSFPLPIIDIHTLSSDDIQCDYLIITTEPLAQCMEPLSNWKSQRGLYTIIETVENITENYEGSDTAECIRNCIIHYCDKYKTTWVVLAGESNNIPTRSVHAGSSIVSCDYYYSNLDDNWELETDGTATLVDANDWEAEVYVGRLPASTSSQMDSLVSRLIEYESNPPVGPWMQNAVFAGTFTNFNSDSNGNNILDDEDWLSFDTNRNHHWLIDNIFPTDWTCTVLGEAEGLCPSSYPYDLPLNQSTFIDAIDTGASIVMADAHGSPVGMYRSIFTDDIDGDLLYDSGQDTITSEAFLSGFSQFNTNGKYCFAFLAACATGSFAETYCLTEHITSTCGIGCIGASQSSYYDPDWYDGEHLGWMTQGLSTRVWEQILLEGNNHPGMALSLAKADYIADRDTLNGKSYDNGLTMAQYNLMGDPEVPLWITIPEIITPEITMDNSTRRLSVKTLVNDQVTSDVIVTVVGSAFYYRCVTDENGEVLIQMPDLAQPEDFTVTVSKKHHLSYQESIGVTAGSANSSLWSYSIPIAISAIIILLAVAVVVRIKRT